MFWFCIVTTQCIILIVLLRMTRRTILESDKAVLNNQEYDHYPRVGMIIPAAGDNPAMNDALSSLLSQDYPYLKPIIVTADEQDPATKLARSLQEKFPDLECLIAGEASHCSQKNYNTLHGIAHLNQSVDIYAFCDSTHVAKPDFIRHLVGPIIRGEAGFTTGYHEVKALDDEPVTLGYQLNVLVMRTLQAISAFTQPWGGAMAIARQVFEQHRVKDLWQENVVDDCSLAGMLIKKRLHVQLCPRAILSTTAKDHRFNVWFAWMQRQILFLKFCVITQWYFLGIFIALLALPVALSCIIIIGGLTNMLDFDNAWFVIFSVAHLAILSKIALKWREMLPTKPSAKAWLIAFFCVLIILAWTYAKTLRAWSIDWHGKRYHVAKGGKLLSIQKIN